MMEQLMPELISLGITVFVTCVGVVSRMATKHLKAKGVLSKLESHEKLVKIVVNAVEQAYKEYNGQEKFDQAKVEIAELLTEKKIRISDKEIDLLIEAMVKEMNKQIKEELSQPESETK